MKILEAAQTRKADLFTIENEPILSINLMERAASRLTKLYTEYYDFKQPVAIFAGPGNNGGDGLVMARLLHKQNYKVSVFVVQFTDNFSNDFKINLKRLENYPDVSLNFIKKADDFPALDTKTVLVDAIFGSGLSRSVEGLPARIIEKMNKSGLDIVAIDTPSGLRSEENPTSFTAIKARYTFTIEFPFLSFFMSENENFVGDFKIVKIGLSQEFINKTHTDYFLSEAQNIAPLIKKRAKFSHKGTFGHGMLFAGSYGFAGASILAAKAAYRSGAGLISVAVPVCNYQILQISVPETMLRIDSRTQHLADMPDMQNINAIAIGPGIGFHPETEQLLETLLRNAKTSIILDADALTILSKRPDLLELIPPNSILTPHPKEFERIAGKQANHFKRIAKQKELARKLQSVIILKGANTSICTPSGKCFFNSTGNPGMATGGSGDVLTGILLGLKAQGYSSENAAILGVYIHGMAGDKAAENKDEFSMTAGDIVENISFKVNL